MTRIRVISAADAKHRLQVEITLKAYNWCARTRTSPSAVLQAGLNALMNKDAETRGDIEAVRTVTAWNEGPKSKEEADAFGSWLITQTIEFQKRPFSERWQVWLEFKRAEEIRNRSAAPSER